MRNKTDISINRILVSLDFDDYGSSFIEPLVTLASQLKAELCALFIENSELQQIANLPFSREITFPMAHIKELNSNHIARHLKQHAEILRDTIEKLSQSSNVTCSFRTAKGPRIESALNESYDFQLVILLPEKYSLLKRTYPKKLGELINPTVLIYNASIQAQKSIYIIKSLVDNGDLHQLTILLLNPDDETIAKQIFSFSEVNIEYKHIDVYSLSNVISLIKSKKTGLLILPLDNKLIDQKNEIVKIIDTLDCPLMLVK